MKNLCLVVVITCLISCGKKEEINTAAVDVLYRTIGKEKLKNFEFKLKKDTIKIRYVFYKKRK